MLTQRLEWQALQNHYQNIKEEKMAAWFTSDPQRFKHFSLRLGALLFDYSKNRVTRETIPLLCALATACELPAKIEALFSAAALNSTEYRPALHVALRHQANTAIRVAGQDVMPAIHAALAKMQHFVDDLQQGRLRASTGKTFRDIVNIGIGGSHFGPLMTTHALAEHAQNALRFHFIADIDSVALQEVFSQLDPERTLFIISSKSFTTLETLLNAKQCLAWLQQRLPAQKELLAAHFIAITAQQDKAIAFGISPEKIFPIWDWVGGRYSIWSAIGLPLALQIGMDGFKAFLEGAYLADQHFRTAEFSNNIPVLLGLLGVWYLNFFNAATHAIIPYDYRLKHLRAYLQQLDMESNGKGITHPGTAAGYVTGPIVWGELGIHGQHAFHQLLHQGTHVAPVDFLLIGQKNQGQDVNQDLLIANALSQARALMNGKAIATEETVENLRLAKHKAIPGNRPSNILFMDKLTPYNLGTLLALYEHKIFVQSVIWDLNPFDQWGVELGKTILSSVLEDIQHTEIKHAHDSSTENLIAHYKSLREATEL